MSALTELYTLLTAGTGVIRTRHSDLEREAAERAREARDQVGLNVHVGQPDLDLITHPTQVQAEARLGPEWTGKGVGELATWNYLYNKPVEAAANGLLNSPIHRAVLDNPAYKFWGGGIYSEAPSGATSPLHTRHYYVIWVSKLVPTEPEPVWPFTDIANNEFRNDIKWAAELGIAKGYPDGTFGPNDPVTRAQMMAFLRRALT